MDLSSTEDFTSGTGLDFVIVNASDATNPSKTLKKVYEYWQQLRGSRWAPRSSEFVDEISLNANVPPASSNRGKFHPGRRI